jgi:hypothetical protein
MLRGLPRGRARESYIAALHRFERRIAQSLCAGPVPSYLF